MTRRWFGQQGPRAGSGTLVSHQASATVKAEGAIGRRGAFALTVTTTRTGTPLSFKVDDPKNLNGVAVGDTVEITYTVAVMIKASSRGVTGAMCRTDSEIRRARRRGHATGSPTTLAGPGRTALPAPSGARTRVADGLEPLAPAHRGWRVVITRTPLLVLSAWEGMARGGAVRMLRPLRRGGAGPLPDRAAPPRAGRAGRPTQRCRWRRSKGEFLGAGSSSPSTAARSSTPRSSPRNGCATRWPREILLIALVYGVGVLYPWRRYIAIDVPSWYGVMGGGRLQPSLAGVVVRLRQPADGPVPAPALVLPAVRSTRFLAGLAHRARPQGDPP